MNSLIRLFGALVSMGALIILFSFAWFVAVPLLVLLLGVVIGRVLYVRYLIYKAAAKLSAQDPFRPKREKETNDNVIDVEYTEL